MESEIGQSVLLTGSKCRTDSVLLEGEVGLGGGGGAVKTWATASSSDICHQKGGMQSPGLSGNFSH